MIRNKNQFLVSSEIYHIDTRQYANFHKPFVNLTKYQKRVYYLGVKVFNMLPSYIKIEYDNSKKFKFVLRNFYMQILFISWMNILNVKKLNIFIYEFDWITIKFGTWSRYACMFLFSVIY